MVERALKCTVRVVGVAIFAVLLSTLFTSVLIRYFNIFKGSMAWVEESSRFLFIWLSFLGAVLAIEEREHIRIDVFIRLLPPGLLRWHELLVDLAVIAYLGVMVWYGMDLVILSPFPSSALQLPLRWVYLALPVSGALMAFHVILAAARRLSGKPTKVEDGA